MAIGPGDRKSLEIWLYACALALVACSSPHRSPGTTTDDDGGAPDGGVWTIPGHRLDWSVLEGSENDTDIVGWAAERADALGILPGGDPIVAGLFYEEAVFGEGTTHETHLVAKGKNDIFLARYSPEGVLRWATSAGGPSHDYAWRIKVLRDDRVAVVGKLMGSAGVFGEGEPGEAVSVDTVADVAFVAVYDSQDGTLEWMRNVLYASFIDCPTCSSCCDAVDELAGGEIIVACGYDGPVSVCPPEVDEPLPLAPTEVGGGAVLTFSPDGELIDHMLPEGNLTHYGATIDLRVRSDGGYYLAGSYTGTLSLGSHHLWQVEAAGDSSVFGASFDAAGALEWLVDLGFGGFTELPQWNDARALAKGTDDFILSARYSGAWAPVGEVGPIFQTGEDMTEGAMIALGQDGQPLWWRTTRFECDPETAEFCGSPNTELRGAVVGPYGDLLVPGNSTEMWKWDDVAIGVGGEGVEMLAERTAGNSVIPNGFVAGFSSYGDVDWVSPAVSHSDDPTSSGRFLPKEMAFDSEGNLYIAGETYRRSTFGYGAIDAIELESVGYGIVLLRYSPIEPPE